ncbi:SPFH domain-containing protein [Nocardia sp. NPDC006630]|uniref:SPFH domain-containing protein n=1 Tax=Nocardia sp. NPDC006630 TaxID=3157181 RepID=UPI0033B71A8D
MEMRRTFRVNGFLMLGVLILLIIAIAVEINGLKGDNDSGSSSTALGILLAVTILAAVLVLSGFVVVNPNQAKVIQFFGRYIGSVEESGFHWVTPLSSRRNISLRVRNFETQKLKVNDSAGNPVEIAAVVVYRVVDSFKSAFAVDDYVDFVRTQSETAVRHLATTHPYQTDEVDGTSLRNGAEIAGELTTELRERTELAGIDIIEARITHLAYAPEIAQAMLVRQQADQVVAARSRIVAGAVGMVGMALDSLAEQGMVELDEERKAAMVSNLLVVLCGDRAAQPIVNAGTLYS